MKRSAPGGRSHVRTRPSRPSGEGYPRDAHEARSRPPRGRGRLVPEGRLGGAACPVTTRGGTIMQTVPGPDDFEPVLAAPEEGQGRPTTADRPKASGRKERQPNQPTVPHPEDLADAAERTKDAIAEGRRAGTAGQSAGRLGESPGNVEGLSGLV